MENFDINDAEDVLIIALRTLQIDLQRGGQLSGHYMNQTRFWTPQQLKAWSGSHLEDLIERLNYGELSLCIDQGEDQISTPERQRAGIPEPDCVGETQLESVRRPPPATP